MSEDYGTGLLSEHESPPLSQSEGRSATYQPTEEERAILKLVNKVFTKNKSYRRRYDHDWLEYYKFYRGKQWKEQRPAYRHAEVFNFVMQTIRSQVPIITDARQKFEFLPTNPLDREFADILNQVAEADWQKNNWSSVLSECLYDAHFYGTGIAEVGHCQDLKNQISGVEFNSRDVFYSFPDPNATDINVKANSFVYAEPVDVEVLKREYPDKAMYIKPDLVDLMHGDKTELGPMRFKSPTDLKVTGEADSQNDVLQKNQSLKITCYLHSDEYVEEKENPQDPMSGYIQKKKYPNGRKICITGNIVLSDGPLPYDDGKFPFAIIKNAELPREFWGLSEVEPLKGPQMIFNKVMSYALDVLTLMGNPVWVVDTSAEIDTDNIYNRPGLVIEKAPGSEVTRVEGVELQPYVLQIADKVREYIDSISGANDVTRGVRPEGITAASAIAQLQDAAQTRIREKSRFLDAFLQNVGQMWVSRTLQFTPAPRIVRVTDNQNATQYFKFHVEQMKDAQGNDLVGDDGSPKRQARLRYFVQNQDQNSQSFGKISESPNEEVYEIRANFDVRVSTGSSLGFEKDRKFNQAQVLFDRGALDELELLKAADWPDAESVYAKVMDRKSQMAQQNPQAAQK